MPHILFSYMKLLVFMLLATAARLQAQKVQEVPKTEKAYSPIFYWHLNLQYVNDFQNGNLIVNMDDRYTFGATLVFALNNWEFFFRYRSLTDRYVSRTRIDEMQIGLSYTIGNLLSPKFWGSRPSYYNRRPEALFHWLEPFYLGVTLSSSYFQAGNILGQPIQNQAHQFTGMPKISIQYLDNHYTVALGAEFYFAYTTKLRLPLWGGSRLELGVSASAEIALSYQESLSFGLRSKLYHGSQYLQLDLYLQQLGYYNGLGGSIESVWSDTKTALWLAFSSRAGFYQRRVDMSFGSLSDPAAQDGQLGYPFGFGSLELSWVKLQRKRYFLRGDYSQSLMFGLGNGLVLDRYAFFFRLAGRIPSDFSFVALRGTFGDPQLFSGKVLARKAEAAWLGMFHFRPTLDLRKLGFLEFYAGIGAGLFTMEFLNSLEVISRRSSFQYFTIAGQAGLRWYGLPLRRDGSVYGIEFALFSLFPFSDFGNKLYFAKTGIGINNLQPKLNILLGLTVLIDW